MAFEQSFSILDAKDLKSFAQNRKADGWRYVQTLAVNTESGVDVVYSFMKDASLENHTVKAVGKGDVLDSITDSYLEAFVWENEIHDLFGVSFKDIALDFEGTFYAVAQAEPMTVVSPEQLAAREKARKVAAAKAAKEAAKKAEVAGAAEDADQPADAKTDADADAELEAKLAAMDPAKAAKVRAAMEAKAKKEAVKKAEEKNAELEAKLASMDPEKAAKVRAAMAAKAAKAAKAEKAAQVGAEETERKGE